MGLSTHRISARHHLIQKLKIKGQETIQLFRSPAGDSLAELELLASGSVQSSRDCLNLVCSAVKSDSLLFLFTQKVVVHGIKCAGRN